MSPPPAVPWYSTQAINDYYQRLPNLFAKEIARRQKDAAHTNVSSLKRGPDPAADDTNGMRKRLDTGERRSSHSGSAASPPHARSPSVMSNGTVGSTSGLNLGMSMTGDPHVHSPSQNIPLGMLGPHSQAPPPPPPPPPQQQQQQPQQQHHQQAPAMRVSPETMQPANPANPGMHFAAGAGSGMSEAQMAQARERARVMQMRQAQQAMATKDPQRMPPPPAIPNGLQNSMAAQAAAGPGPGGQSNNAQMMQAILAAFGQGGLQNYHALQQGTSHPLVSYMNANVPGFMQLPLQHQLQRMQGVQVRVFNLRSVTV